MSENTYAWYAELKKPFFAPPSWLFGVVWSILYVIIFLSFGYVFFKVYQGVFPRFVLLPFILNLVFNFIFTPIQFRLKNNLLAFIDVLLVVATLIWSLILIFPYAPTVLYVNIPYVLWGSFASVLQASVTWLNRKQK